LIPSFLSGGLSNALGIGTAFHAIAVLPETLHFRIPISCTSPICLQVGRSHCAAVVRKKKYFIEALLGRYIHNNNGKSNSKIEDPDAEGLD